MCNGWSLSRLFGRLHHIITNNANLLLSWSRSISKFNVFPGNISGLTCNAGEVCAP